jgi:hypothetical protein
MEPLVVTYRGEWGVAMLTGEDLQVLIKKKKKKECISLLE